MWLWALGKALTTVKATGAFETSRTTYTLTQSHNPKKRNSGFNSYNVGTDKMDLVSLFVKRIGNNETDSMDFVRVSQWQQTQQFKVR